jgi:uncharacterized protein YjbJ (UPF0337 family)
MDDRNRRTPAEVAADASIEHTGKGLFNQVKGTVKRLFGKNVEGRYDQIKGRAQEELGRLEAKEARLESGIGRRDEEIE